MELKEHIEYTKKFIKTYFSFSDKQKAQREAACLSLQFSHCVLTPERNDRFIGKYKRPCVGFAMQDCGMGYFIDEETFNEILRECSEEDAIELTALHDSFSAETGMAQLIAKTPAHILREIPTNDFENRTNIGFWLCRMSGTHFDFDKLLTLGIPGLKTEVLSYKEKCTDSEAKVFYDGLLAMLDAFCTVAEKNAELAENSDCIYGRQIAAELRRVAVNKPATLREAIQLFYLYSIMSGTYNFGRMDEYLGDFYVNDLRNGVITYDEAKEALVCLWNMINHRKTTWDARVFVGGKGRRNEENANEFALLAIDVAKTVKNTLPQFSLRFYKGQDERLLDEAYKSIGTGCVYPILYNDDANIPAVQKTFGVSYDQAMQYMPFGCGEYILYHRSVGTPSDIINLLKALEITLFNGYDNIEERDMGLKTGNFEDFPDFESFFNAYCRQVEHYTELQAEHERIEYDVAAEHSPFLMASLLYDDCIARGKAIFDGGVRYLGGTFESYGNTNTADSLTAIKKLVFDEKRISPCALLDMLKKNFVGYELERKLLLDAPKYGNDNDEADEMAIRVHEHICGVTAAQAKRVGLHTFLVVVINNSANTTLGGLTMASADGRLANHPMANANNPCGGCDKSGLTAMLNSLLKMRIDVHAGSVQNIKFSKDMFQNHFAKTRVLLDTYFENGGAQLMINVLGRDDLENARKEPEKYQNLIVRVGGFCARFVELIYKKRRNRKISP